MPAADPARVLEGLSDAQRHAVLHAAGPLLVLAGPGTGKTRVITRRVARLIADGAPPESVLAVTFTVKAAAEMRARLADLLGLATAERATVTTFHGFGHRLLTRFAHLAGLPHRWQIADSAQRKRLLARLIREHGLFPDLAPVGRDSAIPPAERFIEQCRHNGVFPEECLRHAAGRARDLERAPAGAAPDDATAAERQRLALFAERARLYQLAETASLREGLLTYEHLLTIPLRLLTARPGVAALCRDEYRHIVVDEFQDANAAQVQLLAQLAPPARSAGGGGTGPDLCVVGDDDQAIYAFRGASQHAFARFASLWPGHAVVRLDENHRCAPAIVAAANHIISRATSRFDPGKAIRVSVAHPEPGCAELVEGLILEDDAQTAEAIAALVRADRPEARPPGARYRGYAVIARGNADLDQLATGLAIEGLPVRRLRPSRAASDPVLADLRAWIELLAAPPADAAVRHVLARPALGVPVGELARLAREHGVARSRDPHAPASFRHYLARLPEARAQPGIARFLDLSTVLSADAATLPAHEAVMRIIRLADLAAPDARAPEGPLARAARIASLVRFVRLVGSRAPRLDPPGTLAEFWAYYQDLSDEDRSSLCGDEELRLDDDPEPDDQPPDAIALLTAHSAKGLEFDTVFLPRVRPRGYPPAERAQDPEHRLPPALLAQPDDPERLAADAADEERRVFYVACTRARRRLVLLAKRKASRGSGTDFFLELTREAPPGTPLVATRELEDVLAEAPPPPADAPAADLERHELPAAADPARLIGTRARAAQRSRLADLALAAETAPLDPARLAELAAQGHQHLLRLAVAAHLERTGTVPSWALDPPAPFAPGPLRDYASALATQARQPGAEQTAAGLLLRPLTAPLNLSYSAIDSYLRCPRCFYLRTQLDLGEPDRVHQFVGKAAHIALERFYRALRDADTGETPPPAHPDLLALAREALEQAWPPSLRFDPAQLEQLLAQMRLLLETLHTPDLHVLEIEHSVRFPYARAGLEHLFTARLDRVDQLPDGSVRIVDYKSGQAWKKLATPKPDDLQLGIYLLAARHLFGPNVRGRAEYWLLSTGQRGLIEFDDLDLGRIEARISQAIDGMLTGDFEPARACDAQSPCRVFDLT